MGGWNDFCLTQTNDLKWKQKEFNDIYGPMSQRKHEDDYLVGIFEMNNTAKGYKGEEMVIIPKATMTKLIGDGNDKGQLH